MKRWDIINTLIKKYDCKTYLEVGVHHRECFDKIECGEKTCVDPKFPADFFMTSDAFFRHMEDYDRTFDAIFLDGLHTADQIYKDLVNSLKLNPRFIVVHDVNPETEWHTRPVDQYKRGEEWNGTTYRGFIEFKHRFKEHEVFTVDTDYGCGVVIVGDKYNISWDAFCLFREKYLSLVSVKDFIGMVD